MGRKSNQQKQKEHQQKIDDAKKLFINWWDVIFKNAKPIKKQ